MFKFVCNHLDSLGIPMNRMFVSPGEENALRDGKVLPLHGWFHLYLC